MTSVTPTMEPRRRHSLASDPVITDDKAGRFPLDYCTSELLRFDEYDAVDEDRLEFRTVSVGEPDICAAAELDHA
jgi:hypothetical protein